MQFPIRFLYLQLFKLSLIGAVAVCFLVAGCFASEVYAEQPADVISEVDDIKYVLTTSVYTRHFNPKSHHNNHQKLIGIERHSGGGIWGVALFKNSFYQDSQFVYWGKEFRLDQYAPGLKSKWGVGLLHGYKGESKNKIPLNNLGVAPAILPTIGYTTRYLETDVILLGLNAVTLSVSVPVRF